MLSVLVILLASESLAQFQRFPPFEQAFQQQQQQEQFRVPRQQQLPGQIFNVQRPQRPFQQQPSRPFQAMAEQVRQTRQQAQLAQQPFRQPTSQQVRKTIPFANFKCKWTCFEKKKETKKMKNLNFANWACKLSLSFIESRSNKTMDYAD